MKINLMQINIISAFIIVIIISFFLGYTFDNTFTPKVTEQVYNSNCSNMSLVNTAYCLNNELRLFFFYNKSQIGKSLTLEELKKEGGVCIHSANYFENRGKELGFYSKRFIFQFGEDNYHAVSIISDKTGYCLEDMYNVNCVKFNQDSS